MVYTTIYKKKIKHDEAIISRSSERIQSDFTCVKLKITLLVSSHGTDSHTGVKHDTTICTMPSKFCCVENGKLEKMYKNLNIVLNVYIIKIK